MNKLRLEVSRLSCSFGPNDTALRDCNASFCSGVTALLGPNGSGKSSLLRCLAQVIPYQKGQVFWNREDIYHLGTDYRLSLGYLPQDFAGYDHMTVQGFLGYMAALKLLPAELVNGRITDLLAQLGLSAAATIPLARLSPGVLQRVGIAQALLSDPDLLLLDEPMAGLDLEERRRLSELLRTLPGERIIIFSTHLPEDAEAIADEVVILREGSLVLTQSVEQLHQRVAGQVWSLCVTSMAGLPSRALVTSSAPLMDGSGLRIRLLCKDRPAPDASACRPTLEDAYLAVVRGFI